MKIKSEFYVDLETRIKVKLVSSNSTHVKIREAFSPMGAEMEITWQKFHAGYKPLREANKNNEGWD